MRPLAALVGLCLWAVAVAATPSALYNGGNARYRQGDFEGARGLYLQAVEAGGRDPRLCLNLGNACYKSRRLGEAILWYERGLRLLPRDADLQANRRFAEQFRTERESPVPDSPAWRAVVGAYLYPSLDELCLGFAVVLAVTLGAAGWRLWQPARLRRASLVLLMAAGSLLAANGALLAGRLYRQAAADEAVVLAAQATARSAPADDQAPVFVVHEGAMVRVERREGAWVLVRLSSGPVGWLPATAVETI
jgi:tetratricopeptide (TPR) repeat protein